MPKAKLRPRYEMKNVPEWAIKELRDYAEERGIDRGEAFAKAVEALEWKNKIERAAMTSIMADTQSGKKIDWVAVNTSVTCDTYGISAEVSLRGLNRVVKC